MSDRKFRRDKRPTLRETAIRIVRKALDVPGSAEHRLCVAARALATEALRVARK